MASDNHPDIRELKPYVAIGPTEDLSVTIHKNTFDSTVILFIVFFVIAILIVVGICIYFALERSKLPPPPPPLKYNTSNPAIRENIGASTKGTTPIIKSKILAKDGSEISTQTACRATTNTRWTDDGCECEEPYFGGKCQQEKHDKKYFAVGMANNIKKRVIGEDRTRGKSFNSNGSDGTCSDECNRNEACIGFIYNKYNETSGNCELLGDNVVVEKGKNLEYSPNKEATLYMKSSANLHFEDRIFLEEFKGITPPRYWLVDELPSFVQLIVGEIRKIKFAPKNIIIAGKYTGIYCRHKFTQDDINILVERGVTSECYIHYPGTNINIPIDWGYRVKDKSGNRPIYVAYI